MLVFVIQVIFNQGTLFLIKTALKLLKILLHTLLFICLNYNCLEKELKHLSKFHLNCYLQQENYGNKKSLPNTLKYRYLKSRNTNVLTTGWGRNCL